MISTEAFAVKLKRCVCRRLEAKFFVGERMKTAQFRCLRTAASISDIDHDKLTEVSTAASLKTDLGWFSRQCESGCSFVSIPSE